MVILSRDEGTYLERGRQTVRESSNCKVYDEITSMINIK